MADKKSNKVVKVIATIVGIAVVATAIQWGRFYSKTKDLVNGTAILLPKNYFPFNGTFAMENDKITKK